MDDEEEEDGERASLVILSLPSRRWDTLEERFDLSPLCPANKRDNFSNLNRTPFESTGWNELEEHHYVKQIYPRARRGVTWFRWKKKGEFFVFGRGRKIFLVFILFLSNPSYSLSKFEEVWKDLLLLIRIRNTSSFGKRGIYLFIFEFDYSLKKLKLVLNWLYHFIRRRKWINGVFMVRVQNF